MKIGDVLNDVFGYEKTKFYNAPDIIQNEHYVRYKLVNSGEVILIVGCNDGEVPIGLFRDPSILKKALDCLIYGWEYI